jgi:HEPN domain-containing protein
MREAVIQLLKQSFKDFEVAKQNYKLGNYYVTAFYCQQSAEKLLKAVYIIEEKKEPLKTHNLRELALLLKNIPQEIKTGCMRLNPHYYQSRYPDAVNDVPFEVYDDALAKELIGDAGKIHAFFRKRDKLEEFAK